MVTAAKKAAANKASAAKAAPVKKTVAKKAPAPKKEPVAPKKETVVRDMTAYDNALSEYRELKKGASEQMARVAYQARRATPDEAYAKTTDEALAKLQSIVAAFREWSRLLNEVAPSK